MAVTPPLLIRGMFGLGDNIMQRPFVRAAAARERVVYLQTPWPELYADLGNVRPVRTETPLRTQRRNERRSAVEWWTRPNMTRTAAISYGTETLKRESIAAAMERALPLEGAEYRLDLPATLPPAPSFETGGRPIALIRPVTERREWLNPARNPRPEYVAEAARLLMRTHFVLVVADLLAGEEWSPAPLPPHHLALTSGEIATPALLSLLRESAVVVGGVGWIVPASIAAGTRAWIILGGNGAHNAPEKITDPRQDLTRIGFARPDRLCMCDTKSHSCDKVISDHAAAFRTWAAKQEVPL